MMDKPYQSDPGPKAPIPGECGPAPRGKPIDGKGTEGTGKGGK